jgi:ribonucleoside-diphosphate reductase beta chain
MLINIREYYRPFEYPEAYDFYRSQQMVHWTKDEIKMAQDLQDWNLNLTLPEKNIIGGILKGFTQMEILVGDYWRQVGNWFPKPEVAMMASAFSYFESIHMDNYAMINEELGLDDFKAFLHDEKTKEKLDYFMQTPDTSNVLELARSLAVFSAFAEGCVLFSSFAVLLSFQKENLLKGVSQIVNYSIRDESLHSIGGIYLFNTLCKEYSYIRESVKEEIYEAAKVTRDLEFAFIDQLFSEDTIRTLTKEQLKNFITHRINMKTKELGYEPQFYVDNTLLQEMSWFDELSSGQKFGDFFAVRISDYTDITFKPSDLF